MSTFVVARGEEIRRVVEGFACCPHAPPFETLTCSRDPARLGPAMSFFGQLYAPLPIHLPDSNADP